MVSEDRVFVFGLFRFRPRQQLLLREGRPIKLGGRAMDILHLLLKHAGEPVSQRALQQFVWPDTFVHESNLKVHIHSLRRALGENSTGSTYIATVPGRGYRFISPVSIEPVAPTKTPHEVAPMVDGLPAQRTLVGREYEIERVASMLSQRNIVTLVGPGGVGKTTVAVAVAHQVQRNFHDGVYYVDFSATSDSTVVPNMLAAACGIRGNPADTVAALASYLAGRRVLIVMDSCEHVLAAVALIATRFQEAGIGARLLATSIEPLRLSTEAVQLIEPLEYPSAATVRELSEALRYSCIELFATRALEWAEYQLTDDDLPAVVTLCERLGGLPLAIELAAAQLDRYSPAALLESLDRRFSVLRNEDPRVHRRHRTLWATLDWSYQLLSVGEATIFRLLSVFSGPFVQEDVAAIAQVVRYEPYRTTVALGGLVAKSLVAAELDGDCIRYSLLDCARVYAAERLSQETSADATYRHFAHFMLTVLDKFTQEQAWIESNFLAAQSLIHYKSKLSDLRNALSWCFGAGNDPALGIRLTVAAMPLWNELSLMAEEEFQVERAIEHSASSTCDETQRAKLAFSRAWSMTQDRRLLAENADAWVSAIELAERTNDVDQRLRTWWGQSAYLVLTGRYNEALQTLGNYREIALSHQNGIAVPHGERLHAMAEIYLGKLAVARDKLERLSRGLCDGEPLSKIPRYRAEPYAIVQNTLALVTCLMGYPDRAAVLAMEAVENTGRTGHTVAQSYVLSTGAVQIAFWNGDRERLARYTAHLGANLDIECMAIWVPMHRFFRGVGLHADKQLAGIDAMRGATDAMLSSGFGMNVSMYLGWLAEALLQTGAIREADGTVDEALALEDRSKEAWCLPDLLRIKAQALKALGEPERAERLLREALEKAAAMAARSPALRAACDLAALWIEHDRAQEAAALLGPIYDAFTEGFGTKDLLRAAALLEATRGAVARV